MLETAHGEAHILDMKIILLVLSLSGILAAALVFALAGWDSSSMSIHGWIALGLGTFLSLDVGGGLMALTFYSAHKGYDDRIEVDVPPDQD